MQSTIRVRIAQLLEKLVGEVFASVESRTNSIMLRLRGAAIWQN